MIPNYSSIKLQYWLFLNYKKSIVCRWNHLVHSFFLLCFSFASSCFSYMSRYSEWIFLWPNYNFLFFYLRSDWSEQNIYQYRDLVMRQRFYYTNVFLLVNLVMLIWDECFLIHWRVLSFSLLNFNFHLFRLLFPCLLFRFLIINVSTARYFCVVKSKFIYVIDGDTSFFFLQ